MEQTTVVLATLIIYKIVLIGIGIFASRGILSEADYYLGDRGMGAWVTALSASSSSSSAWTLLGVSGAAYAWGIAAIWLFPACLGGFLINWFILAPRLMPHSRESGALTVTDIIAGPPGTPLRATIATLASLIVLFSFLFYVASQFQGSGKTFESTFNMSREVSIIVGAAIIMFYTMVGGFRAVSLTDALQGMVMVGTALILPVGALVAVGGFGALWSGMHEIATPGFASLTRGAGPIAGIGFVVGLMGIGLGYPGQPHVVNRFMACVRTKLTHLRSPIDSGWRSGL